MAACPSTQAMRIDLRPSSHRTSLCTKNLLKLINCSRRMCPEQGSKFTHLNFTLGEGGVKVNTFHPTPPHLNFFKKHFHLTSPKGETWVKIFHPTPPHLKFSEIHFHLTSPKGEIWVKIFHPTPPHLNFLNNSPKFTQR